MFGVPWNGDSIQPPDVRLFTSQWCVGMLTRPVAQQVLPTRLGRSRRAKYAGMVPSLGLYHAPRAH